MAVGQAVKIAEVQRMKRSMRHPQHPFQVRTRPWQIAPFFIAPVLPGETMRNLLMQSRCVTDPVKSKLVGWWNEYYFFYVKHRDLAGRDDFTAMMLDPTTDLSAYNQAALVEYYHAQASLSWVKECLKRVTEWYFRDEDEAWDGFTIGNLPSAKRMIGPDALDSAINDTDRAALADVNVDLDLNSTITASEIDQAMFQWQLLRTQGMTNISYEDFLASYGVRPSQAELHAPELVRYVRDWQYPSSHIDPTDGSATSAVSWKIVERADKDRYFREPGFLFGVTVKRPKVYMSAQAGSLTDLMTDLYAWLPAVLHEQVNVSFRQLAANNVQFGGNGATGGNTDAVWVDLKDLFMYGEQFINFALTETDAGLVALPTAGLEKRYASSTDADALFSSASPANQIREDGIVSLSIATTVEDTSQTV